MISLNEQVLLPQKELYNYKASQGGCFVPKIGDVAVRAYPFPFRAGFALSNDCDSMWMSSFHDWHGFVNGNKPTAYGDGLGLEVGDSFWIFSGGSRSPALHRHTPYAEPFVDSVDIPEIVELGKLGWFDTLHSFGNWYPADTRPGWRMHRDQISYGLERLDKLGLMPFVFTNHSASQSNVGSLWGNYQQADQKESELYCLDLYKQFGFKFFWIDTFNNVEKFGDHLSFDSNLELQVGVSEYDWYTWMRRKLVPEELAKAKIRFPDVPLYQIENEPILLPESQEERQEFFISLFNRTITKVNARDGSPIYAFKRQRGYDQPVESTFCMQVTSRDLDELVRRGGAAIVYEHFGVQGPRGRSPVLSKPYRAASPSPSLDRHSVACWQDIAARAANGSLLVATTGRLLNWLWLRETLQYVLHKTDSKWNIELTGIDCPVLGQIKISNEHLNGLAFNVPRNAPQIVMTMAGRKTALKTKRAPEPDSEHLDVVYIPWEKLQWPE